MLGGMAQVEQRKQQRAVLAVAGKRVRREMAPGGRRQSSDSSVSSLTSSGSRASTDKEGHDEEDEVFFGPLGAAELQRLARRRDIHRRQTVVAADLIADQRRIIDQRAAVRVQTLCRGWLARAALRRRREELRVLAVAGELSVERRRRVQVVASPPAAPSSSPAPPALQSPPRRGLSFRNWFHHHSQKQPKVTTTINSAAGSLAIPFDFSAPPPMPPMLPMPPLSFAGAETPAPRVFAPPAALLLSSDDAGAGGSRARGGYFARLLASFSSSSSSSSSPSAARNDSSGRLPRRTSRRVVRRRHPPPPPPPMAILTTTTTTTNPAPSPNSFLTPPPPPLVLAPQIPQQQRDSRGDSSFADSSASSTSTTTPAASLSSSATTGKMALLKHGILGSLLGKSSSASPSPSRASAIPLFAANNNAANTASLPAMPRMASTPLPQPPSQTTGVRSPPNTALFQRPPPPPPTSPPRCPLPRIPASLSADNAAVVVAAAHAGESCSSNSSSPHFRQSGREASEGPDANGTHHGASDSDDDAGIAAAVARLASSSNGEHSGHVPLPSSCPSEVVAEIRREQQMSPRLSLHLSGDSSTLFETAETAPQGAAALSGSLGGVSAFVTPISAPASTNNEPSSSDGDDDPVRARLRSLRTRRLQQQQQQQQQQQVGEEPAGRRFRATTTTMNSTAGAGASRGRKGANEKPLAKMGALQLDRLTKLNTRRNSTYLMCRIERFTIERSGERPPSPSSAMLVRAQERRQQLGVHSDDDDDSSTCSTSGTSSSSDEETTCLDGEADGVDDVRPITPLLLSESEDEGCASDAPEEQQEGNPSLPSNDALLPEPKRKSTELAPADRLCSHGVKKKLCRRPRVQWGTRSVLRAAWLTKHVALSGLSPGHQANSPQPPTKPILVANHGSSMASQEVSSGMPPVMQSDPCVVVVRVACIEYPADDESKEDSGTAADRGQTDMELVDAMDDETEEEEERDAYMVDNSQSGDSDGEYAPPSRRRVVTRSSTTAAKTTTASSGRRSRKVV